jgi:hypothetical protein
LCKIFIRRGPLSNKGGFSTTNTQEIAMEEITIIEFLINSIKEEKPLYSDEQCLNIALEIIRANFPICASKYFKGETWKL